MHEAREEFRSFDALKRFVYKYVRTLRSLKRTGPRAAHLLDDAPPPLEVEEPDQDEEALMERLLATEDHEEQVEILAFVRQSGFLPPSLAREDLVALCPVLELRLAPAPRPASAHRRPEAAQTLLASIATGKDTRRLSANNPEWR
jgi:hypothetical protein